MTDRELLEKAAKAAGIAIVWGEKYRVGDDEVDCTDLPYAVSEDCEEAPTYWNPLEDDGDALRLGAVIVMSLTYRKVAGEAGGEVAVTARGHHAVEGYQDGYMAATRRAIVRAAAALGEQGK